MKGLLNKAMVLKHLKHAGWHPNRKVNIDREGNALQNRGYTISIAFKEFYQEFGRLMFEIEVEGNERSIYFDIDIPVRYDYDEVIVEDYPKIIGCSSLVPVGNIDGASYLAVNEDGFIFAFSDGDVMKIGKGREAVENLLSKTGENLKSFPSLIGGEIKENSVVVGQAAFHKEQRRTQQRSRVAELHADFLRGHR